MGVEICEQIEISSATNNVIATSNLIHVQRLSHSPHIFPVAQYGRTDLLTNSLMTVLETAFDPWPDASLSIVAGTRMETSSSANIPGMDASRGVAL